MTAAKPASEMTNRALPNHPRVPRTRATAIERDLLLVQRASALIAELGDDLDQRLRNETRDSERMRCLREATNRITRTANDAIQAYRRARRSLDGESARDRDSDATREALHRLSAARRDVLAALATAGTRYPVPLDAPEQAGEDSAATESG